MPNAVVIPFPHDARAQQILSDERERCARITAFEVNVTEDNLIAPVCEQLLTPTQAIEYAEMIRARAIEAIGGRRG